MDIQNKLKFRGKYFLEVIRGGVVIDRVEAENLVVDEGITYILGSAFGGTTQVTSHYLGLFSSNSTPTEAWLGSTLSSHLTEFTTYDEAGRQLWNENGGSGTTVTNSANVATFNVSSGLGAPVSLYGLFLITSSSKGTNGGTLISAARFTNSREVQASDVLNLTYSITGS